MNQIKQIQNLNKKELELGIKASWHDDYKHSSYIHFSQFHTGLTEGDLICVFSQFGEVIDLLLIRDSVTGKSKGFGFCCYQDQRSTILCVDNLNGATILGRFVKINHVEYKSIDFDKDRERRILVCPPTLTHLISGQHVLQETSSLEQPLREPIQKNDYDDPMFDYFKKKSRKKSYK